MFVTGLSNLINKNFKLLFFIFLLILGFANFWGSLKNPFFLDDSDHYQNVKKQNPKFFFYDFIPSITKTPGFENFENRWGYYRPLAHFSYSVESSLFDKNAIPYEIVSIVIFIVACFTIFLLLLSVTSNRFLSASASLLYLLHPFNGLCVNYKTAFVFSIQIIFLNLIFIYFSRLCRNEIPFKWQENSLYLLLYFFALLFHELAFVFFLVLAIYVLFVERIKKQNVLACSTFAFVGLFYFGLRSIFSVTQGGFFGPVFGYKIAWYEFCGAYARIIRWVIAKLFYPEHIFIQWATFIDKHMAGHWMWVFAFYIFVFLFFLWFFQKRAKILAFFWILFALGFVLSAPASYTIIGSGFFYFEPHWIFYTNIGFFALAGWILDQVRILKAWLAYVILIFIALFLFFFSFKQTKLFNNPDEYASQWSKETPGFDLPALEVCGSLVHKGKVDKAIDCFQVWTESERATVAYSSLAQLYLRKKDYKKSAEYYKKLLKIDWTNVDAYRGLAFISLQDKDYKESLRYLDEAQRYDIFSLDVLLFKIYIYEKQKDYAKALNVLDYIEKTYYVKDDADLLRIRIYFEGNDADKAVKLSNDLLERSKNTDILLKLENILSYNKQHVLADKVKKKLPLK